jgi:hypothetical protein
MHLPIKGRRSVNQIPPVSQGYFKEGELKYFLQSLINTIDLYHKEDFDPRAVLIAIKQISEVMQEDFEIVAVQKTTDGQVIIKVKAVDYVESELLEGLYYPAYEKILPSLSHNKQVLPLGFEQLSEAQSSLKQGYEEASRDTQHQPITLNIIMTTKNEFNAPVGTVINGSIGSLHTSQVNNGGVKNNHEHIDKDYMHKIFLQMHESLQELEKTNQHANTEAQACYLAIKTPNLKERAIKAFQEGGETIIDEFVLESKYLKVIKAILKGWMAEST